MKPVRRGVSEWRIDWGRRRSESYGSVAQFQDTMKARAARDPAFRAALLGETVEAFAAGDVDTGKTLIGITSTPPSASINSAKLCRSTRRI